MPGRLQQAFTTIVIARFAASRRCARPGESRAGSEAYPNIADRRDDHALEALHDDGSGREARR